VALKTGTLFLYAFTPSNIERFANLFHCLNRENICNNNKCVYCLIYYLK